MTSSSSVCARRRGEKEIEAGDLFPLVPAHTAPAGATLALPGAVRIGADVRYTGERRLRGREANEEEPLAAYVLTDLRAAYRIRDWEVRALVENLFDRRHAAFGTFNVNQGAGECWSAFSPLDNPSRFDWCSGATPVDNEARGRSEANAIGPAQSGRTKDEC